PGVERETDDRPGDVRPRRERDGLFAHGPVDAAPEEADRGDGDGDPDDHPLAEAALRRVGLVRPDREDAVSERRDHDRASLVDGRPRTFRAKARLAERGGGRTQGPGW